MDRHSPSSSILVTYSAGTLSLGTSKTLSVDSSTPKISRVKPKVSHSKDFQWQKGGKVIEHVSLTCVISHMLRADSSCAHQRFQQMWNIHSHQRDCASIPHTTDIMWHATAACDKGFCQKLAPLSLWVCLPLALRLSFRLLSKSVSAMTDATLNDASEVLFYSGPFVTKFINFTLENTILYLIWKDSASLLERPVCFA